jgi:hypothetical protein
MAKIVTILKYLGELPDTANLNNDIKSSTRRFKYECKNDVEEGGGLNVLNQPQIPAIHSGHPTDDTLLCYNVDVSELQDSDNTVGYRVATASYSNDSGIFQALKVPRTNEPWDDPVYNWSIVPTRVKKLLKKTYNETDLQFVPSVDVVNSAGDPIDIEDTEVLPLLVFSYNLKEFKIDWVRKFNDTVNKNQQRVTGVDIPAGKGIIQRLQPTLIPVYDEDGELDYNYYRVDVEILIYNADIIIEPLDQGYNILEDNKLYRIYTDDNGNFGKSTDVVNGKPVDTPSKLEDGDLFIGEGANYLEFKNKNLKISFLLTGLL